MLCILFLFFTKIYAKCIVHVSYSDYVILDLNFV
uniref:Uncharacterized protein n=1 Tax=Anguilla anguilla TaxID=7936 RepID=A0A0E9UZV7_ANGAN